MLRVARPLTVWVVTNHSDVKTRHSFARHRTTPSRQLLDIPWKRVLGVWNDMEGTRRMIVAAKMPFPIPAN